MLDQISLCAFSYCILYLLIVEGQVPQRGVKVDPSGISPMDEYEWYEWVKFHHTSFNFSDFNIHLVMDMDAAIDIGPAMAGKGLKANGQMVYCIYVRSLTPDEIQSILVTQARLEFDKTVLEKLGTSMTLDGFKYDPNFADFETLTFKCCEDEEVPASKMPDSVDVNDFDNYDQYVDTQVRVPIGDYIHSRKVVNCKR
jgi:hypothetical protein